MRREYYIKKGGGDPYVDWLKSLGCVTYLPLSADGDLQDRITGLSLQLTGQGSMVYNATWGGYLVTTPSSTGRYIAKLNSDFNKTLFTNNNFTTLFTLQKITNNSSKFFTQISPITTHGDTSIVLDARWGNSGRSSGFPSGIAKVAYVSNGYTNRQCYQQGLLTQTLACYNNYVPQNWQVSGNGLYFAYTQASNKTSTQYYLREAYIFNTALDLATIRKIQGYENWQS